MRFGSSGEKQQPDFLNGQTAAAVLSIVDQIKNCLGFEPCQPAQP